MTTRSRQWKKRLILVRNISSSIVKTAWVSVAKWAHDLLYWSSRWRQNEKSEKALFEADRVPLLMNSSTKDSLNVVTIQPLLVCFNEFDNKIKGMSGLIQSCCKILKLVQNSSRHTNALEFKFFRERFKRFVIAKIKKHRCDK